MCRTPDLSQRHVPEVVQLVDLSGVIGENVEEVAPPPAHSLVAAVVALQRAETRLDLNLIVHQREHPVEVAPVEGLIHEQRQIQVLARHPPAQASTPCAALHAKPIPQAGREASEVRKRR